MRLPCFDEFKAARDFWTTRARKSARALRRASYMEARSRRYSFFSQYFSLAISAAWE
jgi:hypothetical protein